MSIKTKLGMSMATAAAGVAMVAGGSFALLTDANANVNNAFTAGTVRIDASQTHGDPSSLHPVFASTDVTFNNMAPGDSGVRYLTVKNAGSLGAWVKINAFTESGSLFDNTLSDNRWVNGVQVTSNNQPLQLSWTSQLVGNQTAYYIPAHDSVQIPISYNLPVAANNFYQGATGSVTINVDAVQARNNSIGTEPTTAGPGAGPKSWA